MSKIQAEDGAGGPTSQPSSAVGRVDRRNLSRANISRQSSGSPNIRERDEARTTAPDRLMRANLRDWRGVSTRQGYKTRKCRPPPAARR
jgi:hypothetical protein